MNADKRIEQKDSIRDDRKDRLSKGKSKGRSGRTDVRGSNSRERSTGRPNGTGDLTVSCNDPAWYHLNDVANKAAGNLPYGYPLGSYRTSRLANAVLDDRTPGLAIVWYTPIPGTSRDANSALNVAAQGAYSWIRHANSGHTNYDPSDLMLYYLAIDQLQTLYAWMCKIYGNISKYSAVNRYFPEGWFKAVNIDFTDFQSNIPDFLAYLNMFAIKLATFAVPDEFPIFKRHALLASRMFIDSNMSAAKFQVYDFEPRHIFKYTGLNTTTHTTDLTPVKMPNVGGEPMKFSELVTFADSLINPLISNVDDFGTMSGDIRKAYLNRGLFMVNQIGSDYATDFTYDEMILQQIHNMDMWGDLLTDTAALGASEDDPNAWINVRSSALDDVIMYKPHVVTAMPYVPYKFREVMKTHKCVLTDKDDPTPDETFEITRNVAFAHYLKQSAANNAIAILEVTECGTEVFEDIAFITKPNDGTTFQYTTYMQVAYNSNATTSDAFKALRGHLDHMCWANAFRYVPEARTIIVTNAETQTPSVWVSDDNRSLQNWTMMDENTFSTINRVAMMSLWNVPRLGNAF